eukprot:1075631-Pleurochrysis_carterae.AAC.3
MTNRRGGARPTMTMGLSFLDGARLRGKPRKHPTITLPLSTVSRAFLSAAASGRCDYGRASHEVNVRKGSLLHNNKAVCNRSARLHRKDRGKEPSGSRCRHALRGMNLKTRTNRAKMYKCRCQNIRMRMSGNQY